MQQLIIGLGNPGDKYAGTRHNVGFALVKKLAREFNAPKPSRLGQTLLSSINMSSGKVILGQPLTYMNRSGWAVKELIEHYQLDLNQLLIVHDDLDIELGRLRFRPHGSPGGHRGVASIIRLLDTQEFPRLKIGIGHLDHSFSTVDYVLGKFTSEENKILTKVLEHALEAVKLYLEEGIDAAMNEYNGLDLS